MSEEATLDEFVEGGEDDSTEPASDADTLDQEQFGPFTLSTPGEWSAKRLGDIKRLITRGKQPTYDDDGIPVINQECIYWDGWHFENLRYLDEDVGEAWKDKYFPQRGDVILNSTGQGTLGRAQVYPDNKRRAIDSHVTLLRTDNELNPYFHRYFLESHLGQALLYSMCVNGSTGQIELSKTRLDLQPVPLPPLPEQRKIAAVLYTVDQTIENTEEIVDQLSRIKKAVTHNLLSGNGSNESINSFRVGPKEVELPKDWKVKRVSEISDIKNGNRIVKGHDYSDSVTAYPFIRIVDMENGTVSTDEIKYLEQKTAEKMTRGVIHSDDVYITVTGRVGDAGTIPDELDGARFTDNAAKLYNLEGVLPEYLSLYLRSKFGQDEVHRFTVGSTQPKLSMYRVEKMEVIVPPLEEQERIVNQINNINESRKWNERTIQNLKRLKRGLMQDLLSGTVRTTDANIEVPEEIAQYG